MSINNKKLIRDALGSPIPQIYDEGKGIFIASTGGTGDASSIDFTKIKLIRDALGGVIPQYFDMIQSKFVPVTIEGGGGGGQGKDGSKWFFGENEPDNGGGADGDYYLQSNGNVWNKQSSVWVFTGINLQGDDADLTELEHIVTAHLDKDVYTANGVHGLKI
ncbi:hypothetical protein, partial [Metasolibacillus meyeri]|uniref:hypothetical protein n=1 Tax=Metasolibacillus meyeri TaxID=1071052 RepID=UPI00128FE00B